MSKLLKSFVLGLIADWDTYKTLFLYSPFVLITIFFYISISGTLNSMCTVKVNEVDTVRDDDVLKETLDMKTLFNIKNMSYLCRFYNVI